MKVLVIVSCSKNKRQTGWWPAAALYTGRLNHLTNGVVQDARHVGIKVDYFILSALHGFLAEDTPTVAYNVSFDSMTAAEIDEVAGIMDLPRKARLLINRSVYDRVFLLLGRNYQRACKLNEINRPKNKITLYAPSKDLSWPLDANWDYVPAGNAQAKQYGGGATGVKAILLRKDLGQLSGRPRLD